MHAKHDNNNENDNDNNFVNVLLQVPVENPKKIKESLSQLIYIMANTIGSGVSRELGWQSNQKRTLARIASVRSYVDCARTRKKQSFIVFTVFKAALLPAIISSFCRLQFHDGIGN